MPKYIIILQNYSILCLLIGTLFAFVCSIYHLYSRIMNINVQNSKSFFKQEVDTRNRLEQIRKQKTLKKEIEMLSRRLKKLFPD